MDFYLQDHCRQQAAVAAESRIVRAVAAAVSRVLAGSRRRLHGACSFRKQV